MCSKRIFLNNIPACKILTSWRFFIPITLTTLWICKTLILINIFKALELCSLTSTNSYSAKIKIVWTILIIEKCHWGCFTRFLNTSTLKNNTFSFSRPVTCLLRLIAAKRLNFYTFTYPIICAWTQPIITIFKRTLVFWVFTSFS
jgi:hypothetical protein